MATATEVASPPERAEMVPQFFDTGRIVTPADNPPCKPAIIATLLASVKEHGQLMPGWVAPSEGLAEGKRLCLEGAHRLDVCRQLGIRFWAFDLGRFVEEEERIRLAFSYNHSRRVMGRDEIAERGARYMELTGCTAEAAARMLGISGPTLSRAFGERRIPPELRPRADRLSLSIRSLVAAAPTTLMVRALEFAETPWSDGKPKTRDQVAAFIRDLKKGKPPGRKPKAIPLKVGSRVVTLAVAEGDTAATVVEDLKNLIARLGKLAEVKPEGWPFHFQ